MNSSPLPVARSIAELRERIGIWRRDGLRIALVPTMGALHAGHLSLVRAGFDHADRVVVSIFVNPTQFSPAEDFDRYPRDEAGDLAKLAGEGANLVFMPGVDEMYPPGATVRVQPGSAAEGLEGDARPHHFGGVATICAKLFLACLPDAAMFGEKDYQQLRVVAQMAQDLNMPLRVVGVETVREADGLAMSSRNAYLSAEERAIAGRLNVIMRGTAALIQAGTPADEALKEGEREILEAGFHSIDYLAWCDGATLAPLPGAAQGGRILFAGHLGRTRLIDNLAG